MAPSLQMGEEGWPVPDYKEHITYDFNCGSLYFFSVDCDSTAELSFVMDNEQSDANHALYWSWNKTQ